MKIGEFIAEMEGLAPPELAEDYDSGKIGLIIEGRSRVERICCALDPTPAVVREAVCRGADMLVVHHTPLWTPVTSLRGSLAAMVKETLSAGLNVYVMHTNFDHAPGGINDSLARLLEMEDCRALSLGLAGMCRLGMQEMADRLGCPLRVWGKPVEPGIMAVAGGSGFSKDLIEEAVDAGATSFLSSELKHSVARESPLTLIEATHYALEAPGMRELAERMKWEFLDDTPPLRTWTPKNSSLR